MSSDADIANDPTPEVQPSEGEVIAKRTLAIIAAIVFAPVVLAVVLKIIFDIRRRR